MLVVIGPRNNTPHVLQYYTTYYLGAFCGLDSIYNNNMTFETCSPCCMPVHAAMSWGVYQEVPNTYYSVDRSTGHLAWLSR